MLLFKRFATLVIILFNLPCWSDDDLASLSNNNTPLFSEVTQEVGITFRHFDGRQGNRYFIETIGSGCAVLDYNNDGVMDLYLVNANSYPDDDGKSKSSDHVNQLYRNTGAGGFVLVNAGVEDKGYGTGVAVADYDGDNWLDLYITNFGVNRLYRNLGDGTFQDVTQLAGVAIIGAFCVISSFILLFIVKAITGLRVSEEEEKKGLDLSEHSMEAYADFRLNQL